MLVCALHSQDTALDAPWASEESSAAAMGILTELAAFNEMPQMQVPASCQDSILALVACDREVVNKPLPACRWIVKEIAACMAML